MQAPSSEPHSVFVVEARAPSLPVTDSHHGHDVYVLIKCAPPPDAHRHRNDHHTVSTTNSLCHTWAFTLIGAGAKVHHSSS